MAKTIRTRKNKKMLKRRTLKKLRHKKYSRKTGGGRKKEKAKEAALALEANKNMMLQEKQKKNEKEINNKIEEEKIKIKKYFTYIIPNGITYEELNNMADQLPLYDGKKKMDKIDENLIDYLKEWYLTFVNEPYKNNTDEEYKKKDNSDLLCRSYRDEDLYPTDPNHYDCIDMGEYMRVLIEKNKRMRLYDYIDSLPNESFEKDRAGEYIEINTDVDDE
jgi:hypothetical protein